MKIKELLAKPESWTKGRYARDTAGNGVGVNDEKAVCWCLRGAIWKCYGAVERVDEISEKLYDVISARTGQLSRAVVTFNDHPETTHAEVLAVCEEADV